MADGKTLTFEEMREVIRSRMRPGTPAFLIDQALFAQWLKQQSHEFVQTEASVGRMPNTHNGQVSILALYASQLRMALGMMHKAFNTGVIDASIPEHHELVMVFGSIDRLEEQVGLRLPGFPPIVKHTDAAPGGPDLHSPSVN